MPNQPGHLPDTLTDIPALLRAYDDLRPDPTIAAQRVAFGTSGHRGSSFTTSFNDTHIAAITQAIVEYRREHRIAGPLFLARDTHALSEPAFRTALEVLAANDTLTMVDSALGYTPHPRPLARHPRLQQESGERPRRRHRHHPLAQPARGRRLQVQPTQRRPCRHHRITKWIENRANALIGSGLQGVRRIPYDQAVNAPTTSRHDFLTAYVDDLANVIDFDELQNSPLKLAVDPLGGAGVAYWPRIIDQYNLSVELPQPKRRPHLPLHDLRLGRQDPHGLLQPLRHGLPDRQQG